MLRIVAHFKIRCNGCFITIIEETTISTLKFGLDQKIKNTCIRFNWGG